MASYFVRLILELYHFTSLLSRTVPPLPAIHQTKRGSRTVQHSTARCLRRRSALDDRLRIRGGVFIRQRSGGLLSFGGDGATNRADDSRKLHRRNTFANKTGGWTTSRKRSRGAPRAVFGPSQQSSSAPREERTQRAHWIRGREGRRSTGGHITVALGACLLYRLKYFTSHASWRSVSSSSMPRFVAIASCWKFSRSLLAQGEINII